MTALKNTISSFISTQVPEFIRSQDPNFVAFLQAYFKWLEDSAHGNVVYQIRNLLNYKLIDQTTDDFIKYFKNDFLPYFPDSIALDERKLLKAATKFYQKKGSEESIQFLFRVLYNKDAEIYYPKQNILRLSVGKWQLPQSIKLTLSDVNLNFDISKLKGRIGIGSESNTSCVIESVNLTIDPTLNREIVEMFISNVSRSFTPGEFIKINYGADILGNQLIFKEKIIGSISGITIDPNNQGLKYVGTKYNPDGSIAYAGDPVSIIGGLADSLDAIPAVAYVGNVTTGSLKTITVQNGGYGYRLDPNTIVNVITANGDVGTGAQAIVDGIDTSNQVFLVLNTDSIQYRANVTLGANNFGFSNTTNANLTTVLGNAFTFANIAVGPIAHMNVTVGGSGYGSVPSLNLLSVFDTDYSRDLYAVYIANPTPTNLQNYQLSKAALKLLGRIAAVRVLNGGSGYSNTTDVITVDSSIGYGATFDFITGANGAITTVLVTNSGFGYAIPKPPLLLANSSNPANSSAGSGAVLQAFGDNDGESLSLSVTDIGRILSIRITNRGFDYVSTPNVSLRVEDVVISPISNNEFYYQSEVVFQGANANSATFLAFVDKYDRSNSILRLYNYSGTLNLSSQLVGANQNATPVSANVYGNGKAKANAQFFGGLINYPGFYLNTDGFLSSDQYLQDGEKYHNYSYIVKVEEALASYKDVLLKIAHPAGMKLLGSFTITDSVNDFSNTAWEQVQAANTLKYTGTVSVNAFGDGSVIGSGTQFSTTVNVGDLIMMSINDNRLQTKEVVNVVNNTFLICESNTFYLAPDRLQTINGSNIVYSSGGTSNLVANDIINTNISGNAQTSLVVAVDQNTGNITLNTVFSTNSTNLTYVVYPTMNGVTYSVFSGIGH